MSKPPITHLIIDTSSTDENFDGDCDYALVPMTPDYVEDLLWYMSEVARMRRADESLYSIELWDATPAYFRWNLRLETVQDVYGESAAEVPRGEPILLTADPGLDQEDFQEVECRTVQAAEDEVWWTAYVKHTNVRIETAHIPRKVFLEIRRRFASAEGGTPPRRSVGVHPAVRQIHDLLYLDMRGERECYDPDKTWNADTLTRIAEVVARYIPRPE
jgi:hypothetical protein